MISRKRQILFIIFICAAFILLLSMTFTHSNSNSDSNTQFYEDSANLIRTEGHQDGFEREISSQSKILLKEAASKSESSKIQIAVEEIQSYVRRNVDRADLNIPGKLVYLVTTWRSGSTFLGESISAHPAVFYNYEPLMHFEFQNLTSGPLLDDALRTIQSLSTCDYTNLASYIQHVKSQNTKFKENIKIYRACEFLEHDCFDPQFLNQACQSFPVKLFKVVRLRASAFERFIQNNSHAHIIYLARDPRALYASRQQLQWCTDVSLCSDSTIMCDSLENDLAAIRRLEKQYPGQIHLIKYEDVALDPVGMLKHILTHLLEMSWSKEIELYLDKHTKSNLEAPWSTYRISKLRINKWKETVESTNINQIQTTCRNFMKQLNYSIINVSLCDKFC